MTTMTPINLSSSNSFLLLQSLTACHNKHPRLNSRTMITIYYYLWLCLLIACGLSSVETPCMLFKYQGDGVDTMRYEYLTFFKLWAQHYNQCISLQLCDMIDWKHSNIAYPSRILVIFLQVWMDLSLTFVITVYYETCLRPYQKGVCQTLSPHVGHQSTWLYVQMWRPQLLHRSTLERVLWQRYVFTECTGGLL
jgi:hypothetical protein